MQPGTTRRRLLAGFAGSLTLASVGCGRSTHSGTADRRNSTSRRPEGNTQATVLTVYRDPGCGCCEQWARRARGAGFQVKMTDDTDMPEVKRRFGVPEALASCHTTVAGGYVIEGHVPLADVQRLLAARPAQIKGVAVPGMPLGSPGMEAPDGSKQQFEVLAFDAAGRVTPFKV